MERRQNLCRVGETGLKMSSAHEFESRRFLFITHARNFGGAERAITVLASALAELGHDVHMIQYRFFDTDYPISPLVKIHPMPKKPSNLSFVAKKTFKTKQIRRMVKEIKPDFVIPMLGSVVESAFIATRFLKTKFIATVRNNPATSPDTRLGRFKRNLVCWFSDAVFVQNDEQKKYFSSFIRNKSFAVPNAVFSAFFEKTADISDKPHQIISVGRYVKQKNQLLLIDAVADLLDKYPDIKLSFYGGTLDDEVASQLTSRIKEYSAESNITLCGRVSDIENYLQKADLFVLSSDFEGMPNALMEAMAVGLPCISTDCPTGPSDLIANGENGLLVPVNDRTAMTNAIKYMLDNPDKARSMGAKAKEFIFNNYSGKAVAKNFAEKCSNLL